MALSLAYIGNFEPEHSTENDLLRTMRDLGVEVEPVQEGDYTALERLGSHGAHFDAIMWTSTRDLAANVADEVWRKLQIEARLEGIPTIGVHLDRWWGLLREPTLYSAPFFRCEYVFTADGHDPRRWEAAGINHHWMPPAIAPHNVKIGTPRPEYRSEIAFVGSWQDYGHREWSHRGQLVQFLRRHYGKRVRFWPGRARPAVRGDDLADLYASVDVVVGDSCLVADNGQPWTHYCSDRVFETVGRGGLLLHPWVDGVTDGSLLLAGRDLVTWLLGDWEELKVTIDHYLANPDERALIRSLGLERVRRSNTYAHRVHRIFEIVFGRLNPEVIHLGETLRASTSEATEALVRPAGEEEVPDSRSAPRSEREGACDPAVQAGSDLQVDEEQDPRRRQPETEAEVAR